MSHNQAIAIYGQLFNHRNAKEDGFYKSLFITPVVENALLSTLQVNTESLNSLSGASANDAKILQDMFMNGIKLLSDAMDYPVAGVEGDEVGVGGGISSHVKDNESIHSGISRRSININPIDDGGEDITSLNGKRLSMTSTAPPRLNEYDEGDDITTLNGQAPPSTPRRNRRGSSVSSSSSLPFPQSVRSPSVPSTKQNSVSDFGIHSSKPGSPKKSLSQRSVNTIKEFEGIDYELRLELIVNITKILQVWFHNILTTNEHSVKALKTLQNDSNGEYLTNQTNNIIFKIFKLPGTSALLTDSHLFDLLSKMKWFLTGSLNYIKDQIYSGSDESPTDFRSLVVIKELIFLIHDILHTLFHSLISSTKFNTNDNDMIIIKSLLYTFYKVDFSEAFDEILLIASNKPESTEDSEDQLFTPAPIRLSFESLLKVYVIIGTLANVPTNYLLVNKSSLSSDITTIESESPNVYENLSTKLKNFDSLTFFKQEVNSKILPILAMNFNYYFEYKPDLIVYKIKNSSFMNWITGNRFNDNLYLNYNTVRDTTDLKYNSKNLSYLSDDPYIDELVEIYNQKDMAKKNSEGDDENGLVTNNELLPITLLLFTYTRNGSFLKIFTKQMNYNNHKVEDLLNKDIESVELFEIWVCLLSYVFQYQFKSSINKHVSRLLLVILLRLTSMNSQVKTDEESFHLVDNLLNYQMNEFKWKICHHKLPIIPNNIIKEGFKNSLLYIMDCLQVLLRFNLTKKLNIESFKIANTILYQILLKFKKNINEGEKPEELEKQLGNYPWIELYKTLIHVIKFINKQYCNKSKESIKSLIEEIFLIFELLLEDEFNQIIQFNSDEFQSKSQGNHLLKSINYELIYELLLNFESIKAAFDKYISNDENFPNIKRCFQYFIDEFGIIKLDNKEDEGEAKDKFDLMHIDFDSLEMISKIINFTNTTTTKHETVGYNYKSTFKFLNKSYDYIYENEEELLEVFYSLYNSKW